MTDHYDHYDIVVVGAGPAGAKAAETASNYGIKVLLLDMKKETGSPVQCAEYVPLAVQKYTQLMPGSVIQKIDTMLTFINGKLASTMKAPGYMLNRVAFDSSLVKQAKKVGVELWLGARAVAKNGNRLTIRLKEKDEIEIDCKIIIGADGPRSTVGKWMSSQNRNFMLGLQYLMPLCKPQSSTDIYFSPEFTGGYAWVFPKGNKANIGVGVSIIYKDRIQDLLKEFIGNLIRKGILKDKELFYKTGGLIPVGGPLPVTQYENMLLAGDAAGHTHPVTGGGIMNAMVCGEIAGRTAAEAVLKGDINHLAKYQERWQSLLGRHLERATWRRLDCDRNWTSRSDDFAELIKRTWISFI